MVMVVMMKWSKDYFLKSKADLQGILPLYVPKKDEFLLTVLAIVQVLN